VFFSTVCLFVVKPAPSWLNYFLLLLLSLVWGSSYILIKKGLIAYTPPQVACLRIAISSLCFLPFFLLRYKDIDWSKFKHLAVVGAAGSFIPAFLFSFAQTEINSSMAGVLSSLTPLFTLLLGVVFFKLEVGWMKYLGVLIGLVGAMVLILFSSEAEMEGNPWYGLLVVAGCFFYALSVNTVKAELQEMNSITLSSAAFVIVGLPAFVYLWYANFYETLTTHSEGWSSLFAISILAIFGTVIASVIFFKLVQLTNPIFASMVSYFIPIVAILWGVRDGEPVTCYHFAGMILILIGVYITKIKQPVKF